MNGDNDMRLFIVRHGESYSNTQGRMMSWTDLALTDTGRAQAACAAPYVKELAGGEFDRIFSSDFKRAKETTEIISGRTDITLTPLIREMNLGELEGMTWQERYSKYAHIDLEHHLSEAQMPGGESFGQLKARCIKFCSEELDTIGKEDALVLIGTHGICMRTLTNVLMGRPDNMVNYINWPDNTSIVEIIYDAHHKIPPELVRLSDRTHLLRAGMADPGYEERLFSNVDYKSLITAEAE